MQRVLITGAAGKVATALRPRLRDKGAHLRLADRAPVEAAAAGEEAVRCDIRDRDGVRALMADVGGVVHLAAHLREDWDAILACNLDGAYNVYEAARQVGVRRIVYASSNHAVGMYERAERLDLDIPLRPDSLYGASKAFGEALSRLYWDKYGIETACLRIGTSQPKPASERALATWVSDDDLGELVWRCLTVPRLGWTAVYGVSANDRSWWDNRQAAHVGFVPRDNAEVYAESILAATGPLDPDDPAVRFQGGKWSADGYERGRS